MASLFADALAFRVAYTPGEFEEQKIEASLREVNDVG